MSDKIDDIAIIMAEIHQGTRSGRIKFVIGDGFYSQQGIKSRAIIITSEQSQGRQINTDLDADRACWRVYEEYRSHTSNKLPPKRYCYLHHLCNINQVGTIITTNYDLYLDSIFAKVPLPQGYILNSAIGDHEDSGEYFYGRISEAYGKLQLWKIHGSFSHISYISSTPSCSHIYRAPNFYMGYPSIDNPRDEGLPSHSYQGSLTCGCDRIAHFIDMNFARQSFSKAIDGAIQDLQAADSALIISMGFTGRYDPSNPHDPRNEELVPFLTTLSTSRPVYAILETYQNPADSYLYQQMHLQDRAMQGRIEIIFRRILAKYYSLIGLNGNDIVSQIDADYLSQWASGTLFDPTPY